MPTNGKQSAALTALLLEVDRLRSLQERLQVEIEELTEVQQGLEEARDVYLGLFEFVPMACLALDSDGAIRQLNGAAVLLLADGRRDLLGARLQTLVLAEDSGRFQDYLRACHTSREQFICETRLARRQGAPIPVRLTIRPSGAGSGFFVAFTDLREREAEAADRLRLATAEREARAVSMAKDQFIAMLSHELRTPLTPVLAAASALAHYEELPSELRSTLGIVQRNIARQAQLIDDLLDVARINHGKLRVEKQPTDVHRSVRDALETLTHEIAGAKLGVTTELTAQRAWVDGDSMRLQQVFWNLLRNAIKFTPTSGHIAIRSWNSGRRLLIEISDDGRGIEPDALTRLFEPFEQVLDTRASGQRGLGLGLPICRGIVQQHHGKIEASSAGLGKGARFVVELGTIDAPPLRAAAPVSQRPPSMTESATRILLVEDHEDTADIFQRFLRRDGYEVQVARSVESALAAPPETFDFLISDIGLGDGSGLDLMRSLQKVRKLRGIAVSGFGTEDDVRASKEAGFDAHFTKPVNFDALLEAIATLRGQHPLEARSDVSPGQ